MLYRKLGREKGQEAMGIFAEFHSENELYTQPRQQRRQTRQSNTRTAQAQSRQSGNQEDTPRPPRTRRGTT